MRAKTFSLPGGLRHAGIAFGAVGAALALLVGTAEAGPPDNDAFAAAVVLAGESGSIEGTNVDAARERGEPDHAGGGGGSSVWYRWTAPFSGMAQIDTCTSTFDTLLAVYSGPERAAVEEVAASDDGCGTGSKVALAVTAGAEYRIAVDGYEGETGSFTLRWGPLQAPPNDDFAAPRRIEGAGGRLEATTFGATAAPGEPALAGGVGATVWFAWTAPLTGRATVETCGSRLNTALAIYSGEAPGALSLLAANDDGCGSTSRASFPALAGTTYRIAVGTNGSQGDFVLGWTYAPANDALAEARALAGRRGEVEATNVGASKEDGEAAHGDYTGGASVWYRWRAPATMRIAFGTCGAAFDTVVAVYRRDGTRLAPVVANDDGCTQGSGSLAILRARAGAIYLIAVDGLGGTVGPFRLTWRPPPPLAQPCYVPNVRSVTLIEARRLIARSNCRVGRIGRVRSWIVPRGRVVAQFPEPGHRFGYGFRVHLEVSRGPR